MNTNDTPDNAKTFEETLEGILTLDDAEFDAWAETAASDTMGREEAQQVAAARKAQRIAENN